MSYTVLIKRSAEKELDGLARSIRDRVTKRLLALEQAPRPRGAQKLTDQDRHRLRVGDYRVLYTVDDTRQEVTIVAVGHRRDVYR